MEIDNIDNERSGEHHVSRSHSDGTEGPQTNSNLEGNQDQEQEDKNWKITEGASVPNDSITRTCSDQNDSQLADGRTSSTPHLQMHGSGGSSTQISVLKMMSPEIEHVDQTLPNSPGQFANGPITNSISADAKQIGNEDFKRGQDALPLEVSSTEVEDVDSFSCIHSPGQLIDDPFSNSAPSKQAGDKNTEGLEGAVPTSTGSAKEVSGNCTCHMNIQSERCASDKVDQREGIVGENPLTSSPGQFVDGPDSSSASAKDASCKGSDATQNVLPSKQEEHCSFKGLAKEVHGNGRGCVNSQSQQCAHENGNQSLGVVADSDIIASPKPAGPLIQNPVPENTARSTLELDSQEEIFHNSLNCPSCEDSNTLSKSETMKSADEKVWSETTTSAVRTTVELDLGGSECTVVKFSGRTSQIVKELSGRGSEEACYRLEEAGEGTHKEMLGSSVSNNVPGSSMGVCNIEDAAVGKSAGTSFDLWQNNMDMQDDSRLNERKLEEGECYDDESCTFIKCPRCNELVISGQLMEHVMQCNAQPKLDGNHISNKEEEEPPLQDEDSVEVECPECGVGFSKNDDLIIHIQIHEMLAKNALKAQESTRMKQLVTQAKEQMVMQDPVQQGSSSKCKVCRQRFADPTMAPYHEMMHDKFPFHCKKCDLFFMTLLDLQRQRCGAKKHHKAFRYKCGTCKGVILDAHKIMKHRRKCQGKVEVCMLCKAKFNSFEDLKCHVEVCDVRKTGDMKLGGINDGGYEGAYNCSEEVVDNHSDNKSENVASSSDDTYLSQKENNSKKCANKKSPSITPEISHERRFVNVDQVQNPVQLSGDIERKDKDNFQKTSSLNTVQGECSTVVCQLCGFEQPYYERSCKKPSKFCKKCLKINHRQSEKKSSVSKLGTDINVNKDANHGHPLSDQLPVHLEATDDKSQGSSIQKTQRKKKKKRRKRKLGEICGACGKEFPDYTSLADHAAGCNHVRLKESCEIEPLAPETTETHSELKVDWQCPQSERAKKKQCSKCNRIFWKDKKFQKHIKLCKVKKNSPLEPKNAAEVISSEDDLPLLSLQKRIKTVNNVSERENDASSLKISGDPIERIRIKCAKTSLRSKDYHTYHSCKISGDNEGGIETVDSRLNRANVITNEKGDAYHVVQEERENTAFTVKTSSVSNASLTNSVMDENISVRVNAEVKEIACKSKDDKGTNSPAAGDDQQESCLPVEQDVPSVPCSERICSQISTGNYEDMQRVEEAVETPKKEAVFGDSVSSVDRMSVAMSGDQTTYVNPNEVSEQDDIPVMPEEQRAGNVVTISGQSTGSTKERHGSSSSHIGVPTLANGRSTPQLSMNEVGLPDDQDKMSRNEKVSVSSSTFSQGQRLDSDASGSKEVELNRQTQCCLNGGMLAIPPEENSGKDQNRFADIQKTGGLSLKSVVREDSCTVLAETMIPVSSSPGNLVDCETMDMDAGSNGCFMQLVDENAAIGHHCVYCAGEFRSREDLWEHAKGCRDNHLMVIAKAVNGVQEMQLVSPDEQSCVPFTVLPDVGVASRRLREEIGVNLSKVGRDGIGSDAIVKPAAKKAKRNGSRKIRSRYRYSKFGLIELSEATGWKSAWRRKLAMEKKSPQSMNLSSVVRERVKTDIRKNSAKKKKKKNKKEK